MVGVCVLLAGLALFRIASVACLILDARVAGHLIAIGWTSMHTRGGWLLPSYSHYLDLMRRWHPNCPRTIQAPSRVPTSSNGGCSGARGPSTAVVAGAA